MHKCRCCVSVFHKTFKSVQPNTERSMLGANIIVFLSFQGSWQSYKQPFLLHVGEIFWNLCKLRCLFLFSIRSAYCVFHPKLCFVPWVFLSLRHFGHFLWRHIGHGNISVICPIIVLKLTITVFISLYFQRWWLNWLIFLVVKKNRSITEKS